MTNSGKSSSHSNTNFCWLDNSSLDLLHINDCKLAHRNRYLFHVKIGRSTIAWTYVSSGFDILSMVVPISEGKNRERQRCSRGDWSIITSPVLKPQEEPCTEDALENAVWPWVFTEEYSINRARIVCRGSVHLHEVDGSNLRLQFMAWVF